MKIEFNDGLIKMIKADLARPCKASLERIGFAFGHEKNGVVTLDEYFPVDDEDYIESQIFGAVFSKEAIKKALKKILETKKSCFQIHEHSAWFGSKFSNADFKTGLELCLTFNNFNPKAVHGALVISGDEINVMYIDLLGSIKNLIAKENV